MVDWNHVSNGVASAAEQIPWLSSPNLAGQVSTVATFTQIGATVIPIIATHCKLLRIQLRETESRIERMLMKQDLKILEKKEELFREIEIIAGQRVNSENIEVIREKLIILGKQLARMEEIKIELEEKKAKIRQGGVRGFFHNAKTSFWMRKELSRLDEIEAEVVELKEEHIIKILEEILEIIRRRELRIHPQAAVQIKRIEKLLNKLLKLTGMERKTEMEEEVRE